MPDPLTELVVYLQIVGLWLELRRATPYHVTAWFPFLVNAALYTLIAMIVILARGRGETGIPTPRYNER